MTINLPIATEIIPMVLQLQPAIALTEDQFYEFCQLNRDFRIERTAVGELVIMPPTGSETVPTLTLLFSWVFGQSKMVQV